MKAFSILLLSLFSAVAQTGGVYRVGGGVLAPTLVHKVEPEYSEQARQARYQGTVILYVEVDPSGRATNIRVQRPLGLGLDEKAIEAVRQWQFRPGSKDGAPVTVAANIEVNFRLLNGWMMARIEFAKDNGVDPPQLRHHLFPQVCQSPVRLTAAVDIDSSGNVTGARILRSTDSKLDEQTVVDALRQWRFIPAQWKGAPEPASGEIDLRCEP